MRIATAVALCLLLSCSKEKPPSPAAGPAQPSTPASPVAAVAKPNLVLITMEATRADRLGCYGSHEASTPALDQLAREGVHLTAAIAVAPLTRPSHASILTGLYPSHHGVRDDDGFKLQDAPTTLAEHLKSHGYATAASIGSRLLAGDSGFAQGFDSYAEPQRTSRTASFVIDDAIAAVNRLKAGPFFLWVQLDDPHAPYTPPATVGERFARSPYDGEIAWMDSQLKRLFDVLRSERLIDRTVVLATADVGESLGEHGEETHGLFLYDSTLRVPMIVRYPPAIVAGSKFEGLVSGVDVAATALAFMAIPGLPGAQGESSAWRITGRDATQRDAAYAETLLGQRAYGWSALRALRTSDEKFIEGPAPELYDLKRDPAETINRAPAEPKIVAETWRPSIDEALRVTGEPPVDRTKAPPPRDVRAVAAAHNRYLRAEIAIEQGQPNRAVPLLQEALAMDRGNPAVKSLLAALRGEVPQAAGGVPSTFASEFNRGNALFVQGRLPDAAKAFRAALAQNPNSAETHYLLGRVLVAQNDSAGAERELRAAVAAEPRLADAWNALGILLEKTTRRGEAVDAYSRALEGSPDHADALFNRGKLQLLLGKTADARRDLEHLMTADPGYSAAKFLEAYICIAEKDDAGAKKALDGYLALPNLDPKMKAAAEEMLQKLGG